MVLMNLALAIKPSYSKELIRNTWESIFTQLIDRRIAEWQVNVQNWVRNMDLG